MVHYQIKEEPGGFIFGKNSGKLESGERKINESHNGLPVGLPSTAIPQGGKDSDFDQRLILALGESLHNKLQNTGFIVTLRF